MGISQIFPENLARGTKFWGGGGANFLSHQIARQQLVYFFLETRKMFDGESFESKTNTQAINNKDFAGQSSVAQPYQFELVCDE